MLTARGARAAVRRATPRGRASSSSTTRRNPTGATFTLDELKRARARRTPAPRRAALRRDLRRAPPQGAARVDRALLPRGDDHLERAEQVVRRRRLAARHLRLPAEPSLAARRDGVGRERDVHVDERAHPVRRGDARSRGAPTSRTTSRARGAMLRALGQVAAGRTVRRGGHRVPGDRRAGSISSPTSRHTRHAFAERGVATADALCEAPARGHRRRDPARHELRAARPRSSRRGSRTSTSTGRRRSRTRVRTAPSMRPSSARTPRASSKQPSGSAAGPPAPMARAGLNSSRRRGACSRLRRAPSRPRSRRGTAGSRAGPCAARFDEPRRQRARPRPWSRHRRG